MSMARLLRAPRPERDGRGRRRRQAAALRRLACALAVAVAACAPSTGGIAPALAPAFATTTTGRRAMRDTACWVAALKRVSAACFVELPTGRRALSCAKGGCAAAISGWGDVVLRRACGLLPSAVPAVFAQAIGLSFAALNDKCSPCSPRYTGPADEQRRLCAHLMGCTANGPSSPGSLQFFPFPRYLLEWVRLRCLGRSNHGCCPRRGRAKSTRRAF